MVLPSAGRLVNQRRALDVVGSSGLDQVPTNCSTRWSGLAYRQRAAIVLRFYDGLPDAEVTAALGCRVGTVASLVHRGLAELRKVIEQSTDRFDDQQLSEHAFATVSLGTSGVSRLGPTRTTCSQSRVGVRAARQRRSLAASAVALVAVASLVGYSIGTTASRGDDGVSVAAGPRGEGEPDGVSSPTDVSGPLLHLFTRTVDGVTATV